MAQTELRVTDPDLVKWFKQYAAARDEKLETIVVEAMQEYRERILTMVKAPAGVPLGKSPIESVKEAILAVEDGPPQPGANADDLRMPNTAAIPPMVPTAEEELF